MLGFKSGHLRARLVCPRVSWDNHSNKPLRASVFLPEKWGCGDPLPGFPVGNQEESESVSPVGNEPKLSLALGSHVQKGSECGPRAGSSVTS